MKRGAGFDGYRRADGRVGVLIADVSGKGTSAALYMAELKGLMLSLSRIHTSPRALLITPSRVKAPRRWSTSITRSPSLYTSTLASFDHS